MEALGGTVEEAMQSAPHEPSGRVRVATMEGIAAFYLSERFGAFNTKYPQVLIELVTERHLINLTKREADVSVSFVPPLGPRLIVKRAGTFGLGLFSSAGYLARRGTPSSVDSLAGHDFVDYVADLVAIPKVHWLLDILQPEQVVFRSTSMAAQQNAIASGRGIGLLPYFSAKRDPRLIAIVADTRVMRELYVSVHEDIEYLGRVRALTRFLAELFERESVFLNVL